MTRPYSLDLRERVVAHVADGSTCRAASRVFAVSVATVVRWTQRQRATGQCAAKPMGGRRRPVLLSERDWLLARVAAAPDLTVRALRAELIERGVTASYGAVWAFLAAEGLTFKKKPARRRAGAARRRPQARPLEAVSAPR
jgi:transposase